jgi:aryl-alcohol dehydrogenase-like predicted oxidoreductase
MERVETRYRGSGKTGIEVSEIEFGTWVIVRDDRGAVEDENFIRAVERLCARCSY